MERWIDLTRTEPAGEGGGVKKCDDEKGHDWVDFVVDTPTGGQKPSPGKCTRIHVSIDY